MDRRQFLKRCFQIGGYAAIAQLGLGAVEDAIGHGILPALVGGGASGSAWSTWSETTEAGIADDDNYVCFMENTSAGGNEVGQGGGLSEVNRTLTQIGNIAGATGSPPSRVIDGINDYFSFTQAMADALIGNANRTWAIIFKLHTVTTSSKILLNISGPGEIVYIETTSARRINFRISQDGGVAENKATTDVCNNTGTVYVCLWANGTELRGGFIDSGSPNGATKPTKLSDFNANDRVLFTYTGDFAGEAFSSDRSFFSQTGTYPFVCSAYYVVISKTASIINNAS